MVVDGRIALLPVSDSGSVLDDLADVEAPTPNAGQGIFWSGLAWVAADPGGGGLFRGEWEANPEELAYSHDFSTGMGDWAAPAEVTTMGAAVGTSKPADYTNVAEHRSVNQTPVTATSLLLSSVGVLTGRTLTRGKILHAYKQDKQTQNNLLQTMRLKIDNGPTTVWTADVTTSSSPATVSGPWVTTEFANPTGSLVVSWAAVTASGARPAVAMAITGVEIYASVEGWTGYQTGEFAVRQGVLWKSLVDDNLTEPGTSGGAAKWVEVPLYATAKVPNAQVGTAYTLALTDAARLITLTNAAAVTLTIPANATVAFPVGTRIEFVQGGAGVVTATPAAGVTLNGSGATTAQWTKRVLVKTATDVWLCTP